MSKDFICTIHDPDRAAEITNIFGTNQVYVKSPIPHPASLPGVGPTTVYELDLDTITPEQRTALLNYYAAKFQIDRQEADHLLEEHGMPIHTKDCTITIINPQKWL